ncbi:recombinase family protein [Streptomyces sp. NBC_01483]|uniref:recombinase family protein n=1 Tax=Streptomyces sp. NBC_01483 TaxID=2903883 RepID=UPI003FCCEFF8
MRIAMYLRLSRDNGGSTSIASQREDCHTLCATRGWDVVMQGQDVNVSGATPHARRPNLADIMARRHEFDALLVARPDRLARSVPVVLGLLDVLSETGRGGIAANGPLDSNVPSQRAEFLRAVAMAEKESALMQTRITRSRLALQQAERWIGGNAPYGYRIVPDGEGGKRLAEHEENAPRMRWIVEQVLAGETVTAVCDFLNSDRIPSPATVCSRTGKSLNGRPPSCGGCCALRPCWGTGPWARAVSGWPLPTPRTAPCVSGPRSSIPGRRSLPRVELHRERQWLRSGKRVVREDVERSSSPWACTSRSVPRTTSAAGPRSDWPCQRRGPEHSSFRRSYELQLLARPSRRGRGRR